MYNDYRGTRRTEWQHTYTGKELLPYAKRKHEHWSKREDKARVEMAKLMGDRAVRGDDPKVKDLQQEIETSGNETEQCAVHMHEFSRKPEREFSLSLGDVVYFGMLEPIK